MVPVFNPLQSSRIYKTASPSSFSWLLFFQCLVLKFQKRYFIYFSSNTLIYSKSDGFGVSTCPFRISKSSDPQNI